MIIFFRKIRQNLLSADNTGKYLKYAIGEIILVVIGILIALSINNWNSDRLDRIVETDYLKRLSNDLIQDTLTFDWTVRDLQRKQASLEQLINLHKNDLIKTTDSTIVLGHISQAAIFSTVLPGLATMTFEELKNTGGLRLIRNTALRSAISQHYYKREHQFDRIHEKKQIADYNIYFQKVVPGLSRVDSILDYRSDLVPYHDIVDAFSKPELRESFVSELNVALFMSRLQKQGLSETKDLLIEIEKELAKQ